MWVIGQTKFIIIISPLHDTAIDSLPILVMLDSPFNGVSNDKLTLIEIAAEIVSRYKMTVQKSLSPQRLYGLAARTLNYEFMRQALMAGVLMGILCPIVGTYLLVQRMALLGDVVAHAVLPGLAIANFLNIPLIIGAFVFGMFGTFVTGWIRSQSKVKVDAAMAITLSSFFSLGIVLFTSLGNRLDLEELLFGDILSIAPADVWEIGFVTLAVLVGVKVFYRELLFLRLTRWGQKQSACR